ncbi:MAG: fucose isomerase [Planctomycetaceae bacterium]|nr:fucose isomerase [Planctomycetaceae bacterium]
MLKHIPGIVSPDLMLVLMQMGHGDELVIADGNYPADSNAQRIVRADGHGAMPLVEAILKFLPIDTFVDDVAVVMRPVDANAAEPPIWNDFRRLLRAAEGREIVLTQIDREAFYHRSRSAYAVVATGETALYANVILKKGVVGP